MGELKVKLGDPVIFNKSGNQGNQWNMLQLHLQGTGPKEVRTRLNWHSIQRHIITRPYKLFQNCENSVISFTLLLYSSDEISSKAHSIPSKHYTAQFLPAGLLQTASCKCRMLIHVKRNAIQNSLLCCRFKQKLMSSQHVLKKMLEAIRLLTLGISLK